LVIDDVQWADELTEGVLRRLILDDTSALDASMVLTLRSEEPLDDLERLMTQPMSEVLELPRLMNEEVKDLARQMLADPDPPAGLPDRVVESCAGNPFCVAAYVNQAVAHGAVAREEAGWRREDAARTLTAPPTLQTLLASRLDDLELDEHSFIDAGSV